MKTSRRDFIKASAVAGAGFLVASGNFRKQARASALESVAVAGVGVGGKGGGDITHAGYYGKVVALCDVDTNTLEGKHKEFKDAKTFVDYRDMYAEMMDKIDAVTVGTPDHMHAIITAAAIKAGKHVYTQKPLTRTIYEARWLGELAKKHGVCTQMGNQGSVDDGLRKTAAQYRAGVVGEVKEVHVWTNRPIWPQGLTAKAAALRPSEAALKPKELDWNLWIGTGAMRDYKTQYTEKDGYGWNLGVYHRFCWRGFRDFGTGAFGDMACHTMNLPFRGLELGRVTRAVCRQAEEANDVSYPVKSRVEVFYAPRKSRVRKGVTLPEVKLVWYDGNQQPPAELMPQVVATLGAVPKTGCLIIGSKGIMCSTNDYGQEAYIAMKEDKKVKSTLKHEACQGIASYIAVRSEKGTEGQYPEFADAVKGIGPVHEQPHSRCFSDIEHSIPMLEGMLVGCVAQMLPGPDHLWDADNRIFDSAAANMLVKPFIRSGWEF